MSELQAALGISQIKKINKFLKYRRSVARIYDKEFKKLDLIKIPRKKNCNHSYHLYPILIDFKKLKKSKKNLIKIFFKKKIKLQVHYKPTHLFSFYKKKNTSKLNHSENFYNQELSLPIFFDLKKKDIYKIIDIVKKFLSQKI